MGMQVWRGRVIGASAADDKTAGEREGMREWRQFLRIRD